MKRCLVAVVAVVCTVGVVASTAHALRPVPDKPKPTKGTSNDKAQVPKGPQGVYGRLDEVTRVSGGRVRYYSYITREALSAEVYVFKGSVAPFRNPDPKHKDLVKIVHSDKQGRYEIELPPGQYTLALAIGSGDDKEMFYRSTKSRLAPLAPGWIPVRIAQFFRGDEKEEPKWLPTRVEKGKWAKVDMQQNQGILVD